MNPDFLSSELFVMSTKSTKGKQNKTTKEKSAIKKKTILAPKRAREEVRHFFVKTRKIQKPRGIENAL